MAQNGPPPPPRAGPIPAAQQAYKLIPGYTYQKSGLLTARYIPLLMTVAGTGALVRGLQRRAGARAEGQRSCGPLQRSSAGPQRRQGRAPGQRRRWRVISKPRARSAGAAPQMRAGPSAPRQESRARSLPAAAQVYSLGSMYLGLNKSDKQ